VAIGFTGELAVETGVHDHRVTGLSNTARVKIPPRLAWMLLRCKPSFVTTSS
jgi:hypothetical protein